MSPQDKDRLHKAIAKITRARGSIIRTAAAWQAEGIETSPLTEPLFEMQEALAQLELLAASLPASATAPLAHPMDARTGTVADT